MSKTLKKFFNIGVLFIIGVTAALVAHSLRGPQFEIINESTEIVFVIASWGNQKKDIGAIQPSAIHLFSIDAEAAMKFIARYPNGREIESKYIYFTSGTTVVATISQRDIEVKYGFET